MVVVPWLKLCTQRRMSSPETRTNSSYSTGQSSETHQRVHLWIGELDLFDYPPQKKRNFGVVKEVLKPIEMLCHDLKQAVNPGKPSNVAEKKSETKFLYSSVKDYCQTQLLGLESNYFST